MQEWAQVDGYRIKTIQVGSATVYVRRPVLSKDEYKHRERSVQGALEVYGRAIK